MAEQTERVRPLTTAESGALDRWASQLLSGNPSPWPLDGGFGALDAARDFFCAQGIGALCHHALQAAGAEALVPEPVRDLLGAERKAAVALQLMRGNQDQQVIQWLADIGLHPLVLKGAAYAASLYPEAALRPRCDTDLLFADPEAVRQAGQRLEQEGYQPQPNVVEGRFVSRQRSYLKPAGIGHTLDLHWAISNTHSFVRALPYRELEAVAVALPELHPRARTLGPVHSLLFACLHLFGHDQFEQWPRLLWLYDIHLLSHRLSVADWTGFARVAIAKEIAGICRHVLDSAAECFPMAAGFDTVRPALAAAESMEFFRPDRLKSRLHYLYYDMKALETWADRLHWLREVLLPSPDYMRAKYPNSAKAWLPLLYLHRCAAGLIKRLK